MALVLDHVAVVTDTIALGGLFLLALVGLLGGALLVVALLGVALLALALLGAALLDAALVPVVGVAVALAGPPRERSELGLKGNLAEACVHLGCADVPAGGVGATGAVSTVLGATVVLEVVNVASDDLGGDVHLLASAHVRCDILLQELVRLVSVAACSVCVGCLGLHSGLESRHGASVLASSLVVGTHGSVVLGELAKVVSTSFVPLVAELTTKLGGRTLDVHIEPRGVEVAHFAALDAVESVLGRVAGSLGLDHRLLGGAGLLAVPASDTLATVRCVTDGVVASIALVVESIAVVVVARVELAHEGTDGSTEGVAGTERVLVRLGLLDEVRMVFDAQGSRLMLGAGCGLAKLLDSAKEVLLRRLHGGGSLFVERLLSRSKSCHDKQKQNYAHYLWL